MSADISPKQLAELGLRGRPGERITYHIGDLSRDRTQDPLIDQIAWAAEKLAADKRVLLFQRRRADGTFEYFLQHRTAFMPPPRTRFP